MDIKQLLKRISGRRIVTDEKSVQNDELMYDDVTGLLMINFGCVRVVRGNLPVEKFDIITLFLDEDGRVKDLRRY